MTDTACLKTITTTSRLCQSVVHKTVHREVGHAGNLPAGADSKLLALYG